MPRDSDTDQFLSTNSIEESPKCPQKNPLYFDPCFSKERTVKNVDNDSHLLGMMSCLCVILLHRNVGHTY